MAASITTAAAATAAATSLTVAATEAADECKDDDALSTTLRSCANEPDFAIICAFLQKFAKDLGVDLPNFKRLQEWLTNNDEVSDRLRDLHIKLLRKTRKTVHEKSWESALSKFCFSYSVQDAWEIERFGYKNSSLKVKLRILRELLESQFERNAKFRSKLLTLSADSLRVQPIGRDRHGHAYWLTQDDDCNLRIYQEHLDEEIWQVVATNRDEFVQLIARLRGNEVVLPSKDIGEVDEDTSSSNSCNAPLEKPPPPEEQEDDSTQDDELAKVVPNLKIKLNTVRHVSEDCDDVTSEDETKIRKVKPLVITQAKLISGSPASSSQCKKRTHEDLDKSSPVRDDMQMHNKQRPTLLDAKRIKKPSRYETPKSEDDDENEQDSDTELDDDDEDVDDEDDGEDHGEVEDDDDDLDGEEEDIDSAAAEEDENEQKEIEDDDYDDEVGEEVGTAIQDPPVIVRGQGAGRECKAANDFLLCDYYNCDDEEGPVVGEAYEEPLMLVFGNGDGAACEVGNKSETAPAETTATNDSAAVKEPKATFFFGEPGCLKLSPIKQTPKQDTKKSIFDILSNETNEKSDYDETEKDENEDKSTLKTNGERIKVEITNDKTVSTASQILNEKDSEVLNANLDEDKHEINECENNPHLDKTKKNNNEKQAENMILDLQNETSKNGDNLEILETKIAPECNPEEVLTKSSTTVEEEQKQPIENYEDVLTNKPLGSSETPIKHESVLKLELCKSMEAKKAALACDKPEADETLPINSDENKPDENNMVENKLQETSGKGQRENIQVDQVSVKNLLQKTSSMAVEVTSNTNKAATDATLPILTIQEAGNDQKTDLLKLVAPIVAIVQSQKCADEDKSAAKEALEDNLVKVKEEEPKNKNLNEEFLSITATTNNKAPTNITAINSNISSTEATSSTSTSITLPNRKRRLTDFTTSPPQTQANMRNSTSESEIDIHSEQPEEDVIENELDEDLDIGGKRIKMRPKLTNTGLRRKVEAQKTQIEETTSSSGEEELRSRRKIITPKRKLEQMTQSKVKSDPSKQAVLFKHDLKPEKEDPKQVQHAEKELKSSNQTDLGVLHKQNTSPTQSDKPSLITEKLSTTVVQRQKPTLAEIIEKKLKKTPEKVNAIVIPQEVTPTLVTAKSVSNEKVAEVIATTSFTPPKKSPVTKPLKKNLLTQIRQEESDEDAIPRKRTISETIASVKTSTSSETPELLTETLETQAKSLTSSVSTSIIRITPERQRKRRSSEETKHLTEITITPIKVEAEELAEGVSEKLKRGNETVVVTVKNPQIAEETIKSEKTPTSPESAAPAVDDDEANATPTIGRRSGRRGTAAVVYTELLQPKRTRGGAKAAEKKDVKVESEVAEIKPKPTPITPSPPKKTDSKESETTSTPSKGKAAAKPPQANVNVETKATDFKLESKSEPPIPKDDLVTIPASKTPSTVAVTSTPATPVASVAGRGRGSRKQREVDTTNIIECNDTDTPVRQSRRIAQQKIKEEAERRKLEEIALRTMKQELKKKKKAEKQTDPTVVEPSGESSSSSSESEVELKKKAKKKLPGKDGWSSGSEEQAESEEEEEEPPHEETDPGSPLFKSDHEFSPESDLEDESQVVPTKRARTARKENAEEGDVVDNDEACQKCGKSDHPEWILLCDICDKGYHCSCLSPVLFYIPEGDWFCPPCQQEQLISALEKQLQEFDELVVRKEQEKRLAEQVEQAEREEQQRLEEEKRQKAVKKSKDKRHGGASDSNTEDGTDKSDKGSRDSDDVSDDESKGSKSTGKRAKQTEKSEKSKRRRGDGRSNRRAAKRGTRRRRRNDSGSGSDSKSDDDSGSDSGSGTSSSTYSDSDNEPIYKLRKRRQINVSYRLNEYDDLINSALKKEMDEVAGAGNLGRGKDITTIIEADKEEKARLRNIEASESAGDDEKQLPLKQATVRPKSSQRDGSNDDNYNNDDEDEDDDVPLKEKSNPKQSLKKKPRKLTTLDISSEEDHGSDEDFKTSSFDEDEEDTSISNSGSDSDSSLEIYRRRGKNGGRKQNQRKAARRAARERRKDRKFVVDESDESEEEARPKTKKKRKDDSDYTETESDNDLSELSENVDSADLCDDTTSESSDGAWHPSKRKKQRKSNTIARKSPKLKKPQIKKAKRVEYSDDDISETEPEDDDDDEDDEAPGSGKGSGKQPRSQPLKPQLPKPKTKSPAASKKKKKQPSSDDQSASDDSTRRTRGRRYAYLEDFDDDSSDGGIKPGVKRPDTPPEERQKFIQKQEEIKRMLAEKNAEGAKLAATPRLTPIKGTAVGAAGNDKRTPTKAGDSLSTVPLSVIRQAKVLDIDYLQRKGENIGDLDNVDDVESDFDDADLPDDLPEVMDEDDIARMVEEEEEFNEVAVRELPPPDEVLRPPNKAKSIKAEVLSAPELGIKPPPPATAPLNVAIAPTHPPPQAVNSGLVEPQRKRLPMPTLHPPLLRHQYPLHQGLPHHLMQRHGPPPPMQLLQNALSAPLGQPLQRSAYGQPPPSHHGQQPLPPHAGMQRLALSSGMPPVAHGLPSAHLMRAGSGGPGGIPHSAIRQPGVAPPTQPPMLAGNEIQQKPRGRRKKITPLRDPLQKQQTAAAVTAAATTAGEKPGSDSIVKSTASSTPTSLVIAQAAQLYKPPEGSSDTTQQSVITRMTHLPPPPHARPPPQAGSGAMYELHARYYGQPLPPSGGRPSVSTTVGAGTATVPPPRHLLRHQLPPGMPPHSALRPTYGPPPPLRGAPPPTSSQPPTSSASSIRAPSFMHGEHHGGPPPLGSGGMYGPGGPGGPPPPARHAATHLNPYRPPIYGNPNFAPRVGPPPTSQASNMRAGAQPTHAVDYANPPRPYPYGYYPPPPPLTTPPAAQISPPTVTATTTSVQSSVIVSAPPATPPNTASAAALPPTPPPTSSTPTNHSVSALTRISSHKPTSVSAASTPPLPNANIESTKSSASAATASVITESRSNKQLTTLEAYSKSPGESSGSPAADAAEDSSSTPGNGSTTTAAGSTPAASEFSGLVSYFSSQHDDYNT